MGVTFPYVRVEADASRHSPSARETFPAERASPQLLCISLGAEPTPQPHLLSWILQFQAQKTSIAMQRHACIIHVLTELKHFILVQTCMAVTRLSHGYMVQSQHCQGDNVNQLLAIMQAINAGTHSPWQCMAWAPCMKISAVGHHAQIIDAIEAPCTTPCD